MNYISPVTAIFFRSVIKVVLCGQSQRPVQVRRPLDRYGEWVLSSIQEIVIRLQTLEAKQKMEKEQIRKLKPKLLKKAKALWNI